MKKIFYFIASAIVALGAVACQNEIDENITPGTQNEGISFTVSFDESTRIEGTVDGSTASFEFEGTETLYVGEAKLNNSEDAVNAFTADEDNKAKLNALLGSKVTATVSEENGLKFASAEFELAAENNITLSLACPALYFTVPADTEVVLTVNEVAKTYTAGNYFVGIDGTTAAISYSVNSANGKSTTLKDMQNKVYNLGTLAAAVASVNGVNYTDLAKAIDAAEAIKNGTVTLMGNVALEECINVDGTFIIDGEGTISTNSDVFKLLEGANVTIGENVTLESKDCGIYTSAGANNVTVVLNGKIVNTSTTYAAIQFNGGTTGVNFTLGENGSITNNEIALMLPAGGEYTINGKVAGATGIYLKGGELTINEGATVTATGKKVDYAHLGSGAVCTGDAVVVESCDYPYAPATLTINGGTFSSTNGSALAHYVQADKPADKADATITVTGGTFNTDPSNYVAEGYLALKNDENNYTVEKATKMTLIPNTTWESYRYAAYVWNDSEDAFYDVKGNVVLIPTSKNYTGVIFVAMKAETTENKWDNMQYQTQDMTIKDGDTCGIVSNADKSAGLWMSDYSSENIYLLTNNCWATDNARYAAYTWGESEDWDSLTAYNNSNLYVVAKSSIISGNNKIILCRMNPSNTSNEWGNKWNQTGNLDIPTTNSNIYVMTSGSWDTGTWSSISF